MKKFYGILKCSNNSQVGCLIFIVTFFGCCGAIKEHYCMTMTFSLLLGLIFILEIGAGIAAYVLRTEVRYFKLQFFISRTIIHTNLNRMYMSFSYTLIAFITQVDTIIDGNMVKSMKNYGQPGYDGVTRTWNMVQHDVSFDQYESHFLIVVK